MVTLKRQIQIACATVCMIGGVASAEEPKSNFDDDSCPSQEKECPTPVADATPPAPAPAPAPMADTTQPIVYEPTTELTVTSPLPPERVGYSLTLGGGVTDFAGDTARSLTDVGGSWNLRGSIGTNSYVGVEAAYIGSAQSINVGPNANTTLVGNGAEVDIRVNATKNMAAQPFIYGGAAWRHYSATDTDVNIVDTPFLTESDDVLELPLGIGIAGKYRGFTVDVRGEYRFAADEEMFDDLDDDFTDGDFASLDRWGVMANIGYEL